MFKKLVITGIVLLTFVVSPAVAATPEPPAVPRDYVVDLAGVIRSDVRDQLNASLQELEQKTSAQVLVLTVQGLDNETIDGFSLRMAERWKLGRKGKDNGALIVVAVKDRKYRIEVGYGLESVLPDSLVGTIGREYLVPYFRKDDYSAGISNAVVVIIQTIANHEGVQITGMPGMRGNHDVSNGKPVSLFSTIIFGIFIVVLLVFFITHPRQFLLLLLASSLGGRSSGWSGGGGGGFGGGGGGGFGGGGASGGW